jgi:5-methylthioadenosine/S-adenosylhomocysteine deaminase
MQQRIDLLIHASWIVTCDSAQNIREDHCIAVADGRIIDILPDRHARLAYLAQQEIDLPGHALMPGLVNAHGHAAMSLLRGAADDLALHAWLQDYIWPLEGRWVDEEFVYQGTRLAIAEMLLSGTTCFADMYFFPNAAARAAVEAGMRAQLACPVIDFPTAWASDADDYISKATALHDQFRNHPLVSIAFGAHAPYTVSDAPLLKIASFAEELDIPIHMHVHETAQEVADAVAASGKRPLQRLAELGLISPRMLCVHATQLNDEERTLLGASGTTVVHCPESNLKLASGFCEVAKLLAAGVNVALGTDGAASNNDLDMFSEMRTAALLAKAVAGDASALPAAQALQMATLNGARALGLENDIGSLEIGKYADLLAVNLSALNTQPLFNPASQLVYSTNSRQVSHVWVAGRLLVDNGQLTTVDSHAVRTEVARWQQRIYPDTRHQEILNEHE